MAVGAPNSERGRQDFGACCKLTVNYTLVICLNTENTDLKYTNSFI